MHQNVVIFPHDVLKYFVIKIDNRLKDAIIIGNI